MVARPDTSARFQQRQMVVAAAACDAPHAGLQQQQGMGLAAPADPEQPCTPNPRLQIRVGQPQAEQATLQAEELVVLVVHLGDASRRRAGHHACGNRQQHGQEQASSARRVGRRLPSSLPPLAAGSTAAVAAALQPSSCKRISNLPAHEQPARTSSLSAPAASFSMSGRGRCVEKFRWNESYSPRCTSSTMRAMAASVGWRQQRRDGWTSDAG